MRMIFSRLSPGNKKDDPPEKKYTPRDIKFLKNRALRELLKVCGLGIGLSAVIVFIAYQFVAPAPPKTLRIATASKQGAYHRLAEEYQKHFSKEKITLHLVETSGSVENLKLLAEKKVEVAFVQGGIGSEGEYPEFEGLVSLYYEPLWIFVKKGLQVETLLQLKGKRVGIGPQGSGTRKIAEQLFKDNHLLAPESVEFLPLAGKEGAQALIDGEIDALFIVTRASSPLVSRLFLSAKVDLVSLQRAESYTRLHPYLSHIVLPEGVLDMAKNVPGRNIHFIAPAATLVANDNMHPALVDLMMQVVTKTSSDQSLFTTSKTFPSPENLDFPLNKEAERYFKSGPSFLQRFLPFWAASLVDRLKVMLFPLLALILPLMKILPPTYRWRIRSRIYRWYDELHEIDLNAKANPTRKVLAEAIVSLDHMKNDVRQVEVPLSYAEELYNLRVHIDLLRNQLSQERDELKDTV